MLKAIDFFCGAGGLTRGLLDAGIRVVGGFDSNESCCLTYERNNTPARFLHRKIESVNKRDLHRLLGDRSMDRVLFAGCAPCQPFTKQRRQGDYSRQKTLLADFARLIVTFRPAYVVMENVPGIAKVKGNSTYKRFLLTLENEKYEYVEGLVDAKWFGVPQTRKRWVVLASRLGKPFISAPTLPSPTHGPDYRKRYVTVKNSIAAYPEIAAGSGHPMVPNHRSAAVSDINMNRLFATPPDGGRRSDWPASLQLKCHQGEYSGHTDVYGRLKWDDVAPTLTSKCYSISNGRYGHPEQQRAISLREAASLQSFPDDYVFYGESQSEIGAQIGNAVPVLLAKALGKAILKHWSSL